MHEALIPKHGGYANTKTFQLSEVLFDVTVLFCNTYIERRSRTHDQMVQAGRSGRQNIAEGSVDSATSKKIEMKLTGVAKGSQEELRLDYKDYLRQRQLPEWPPNHPALVRFKALRCSNLLEFRRWVADEVRRAEREEKTRTTGTRTHTDEHGPTRKGEAECSSESSPCRSVFSDGVTRQNLPAVLAANGALSLLNLSLYLLERQLKAQARAFEKEGGFTERLYRVRSQRRRHR
jgi:four helix bundle suffix protein